MDKWKTKKLSEVRDQDINNINTVASLFRVSEGYKKMLIEQHMDALDQLAKASSMGKILQEMLMNYMSPAEITAEVKKRMMNMEVEINEKD